MATYSTKASNIFPLESWRQQIGYHPWHFWGMKDDNLLKLTSACNRTIPQYAWQAADMPSREALKQAIIAAEARLREHLRFSVGLRFIEETIQYPRPQSNGQQYAASIGTDGRWLPVFATENHVQKMGVETLTAIELNSAVTPSDRDGDGYNDTFTLSVATTVTDPNEIAIYFSSADRKHTTDPVAEEYRVAPVKIEIDSGTLTVTGPMWILVRPVKYEGLQAQGLNPATAGVYATTLDIYRRYCDPTGTTIDTAQAVLIWETEPYPPWAVCCGDGLTFADGSADPSAEAYAIARCVIRDGRLGVIGAGQAAYDATTGLWNGTAWGTYRQPDRIKLRYQAGVAIDALGDVGLHTFEHGAWDTIVARLACAELPQRQWACDDANQEIYRWQFDRARAAGANDEQYRIGDRDLNNPFGTAAGAIYAWNQVKNLAITRAVLF